jgi:hypothetical protein
VELPEGSVGIASERFEASEEVGALSGEETGVG